MPRISLWKRLALTVAAPVLLLGAYVLGAPVVAGAVRARLPAAEPVAKAFYAPLIVYSQRPELPGSRWFAAYAGAVERHVTDVLR